jgi:aspartate aminotransferase
MKFSKMMTELELSPIVAISEEVREKSKQFEKFIYLQRGEVDSSTPSYIKAAVQEALEKNLVKYPKSGGEPFFKEAVLNYLRRQYRISDLTGHNVVATMAGQEALELSFQLFHGQRGAGFAPTWSCIISNQIPHAQIDFEEVPLRGDFSIDFAALEAAVQGCSFFYLNSPQNPAGVVFSKEDLLCVVEICTKHGCYVISDEAYENFTYDGVEHFSLASVPQDNIITCFSFSKTFAATGFRLGYAVTRNEEVAQLLNLGNYTNCAGPPTFIQYAMAEALNQKDLMDEFVQGQKAKFQRRRDALYNGLQTVRGVELHAKPQGAFYVFPDFSNCLPDSYGRSDHREERKVYIYDKLMEAGIASVPGSCFGSYFINNVRLSFSAVTEEDIEVAVERMRDIFGQR